MQTQKYPRHRAYLGRVGAQLVVVPDGHPAACQRLLTFDDVEEKAQSATE